MYTNLHVRSPAKQFNDRKNQKLFSKTKRQLGKPTWITHISSHSIDTNFNTKPSRFPLAHHFQHRLMQFIIATQSFPFFPFQLFAKKMSTFVLNIKPGDSISNDQSSFDKQTNLLHNSINYKHTNCHQV